jgi:hypothetical protein
MPFAWRPVPGQVALIEVAGQDSCLTGVVVDGPDADDEPVVVDLGGSPQPPSSSVEVVASFFAPDALYRLTATAVPHESAGAEGDSGNGNGHGGNGKGNGGNGKGAKVIDLRVHTIERVQRRTSPRATVPLRVVMSNLDEPGAMVSVVGRTIDLGEGGCRVMTDTAFPPGCDPTVTIHLPDGSEVVALSAILQARPAPGGFEYRLVFLDLDDAERLRLAELVAHPAVA